MSVAISFQPNFSGIIIRPSRGCFPGDKVRLSVGGHFLGEVIITKECQEIRLEAAPGTREEIVINIDLVEIEE